MTNKARAIRAILEDYREKCCAWKHTQKTQRQGFNMLRCIASTLATLMVGIPTAMGAEPSISDTFTCTWKIDMAQRMSDGGSKQVTMDVVNSEFVFPIYIANWKFCVANSDLETISITCSSNSGAVITSITDKKKSLSSNFGLADENEKNIVVLITPWCTPNKISE